MLIRWDERVLGRMNAHHLRRRRRSVVDSAHPQAGAVSPLMDRLHQLDNFARHLYVAQLLTLKNRLLGTGDESSNHN